jgi:hypothetical protein
MTEYVTKDSGERQEYKSGMRRDLEKGKPRFDLTQPVGIPYEEQMLTRFAALLGRGAEKYGDRNWEKGEGEEELKRAYSSAFRHFMQWMAGETDEDHAAAVWFNITMVETIKYKMEQQSKAELSEIPLGKRPKVSYGVNISKFAVDPEKLYNNMRSYLGIPPIYVDPKTCPVCNEKLIHTVNYRCCPNGDGEFKKYTENTNAWEWISKPAVPEQRFPVSEEWLAEPIKVEMLRCPVCNQILMDDGRCVDGHGWMASNGAWMKPQTFAFHQGLLVNNTTCYIPSCACKAETPIPATTTVKGGIKWGVKYPYKTKAENEGTLRFCDICSHRMMRIHGDDGVWVCSNLHCSDYMGGSKCE